MNYMKMGGPTKMFGVGGLFMKQNAYVLEGGNEGGRKATPTIVFIFDFYGIKAFATQCM